MKNINYKFRTINREDYNFIYNLKKNAYKEYVEKNWGTWNEQEQKKHFDNFMNQVKDNSYIIQLENKDIGFYNGEILENGTYEIGNIIITPEYQGRGIGTTILKDLLSKNEDKDVVLQYFKQNSVGRLYERLGFIVSGETEYHYQMIKPTSKQK